MASDAAAGMTGRLTTIQNLPGLNVKNFNRSREEALKLQHTTDKKTAKKI